MVAVINAIQLAKETYLKSDTYYLVCLITLMLSIAPTKVEDMPILSTS